jgi:hypothetical protein
MMIEFCGRQRLLPRTLTFDELFDVPTAALV